MALDLEGLRAELAEMRTQGLWKDEWPIASPQGAAVEMDGRAIVNLCANNYLGLADDARLVAAARASLKTDGYGMASVRFICGTHALHRALEEALARFLDKEDAILFAACFDANGALFEPLMGAGDAIVSDALNHASIIDGIRLSKAARHRYANRDLDELETRLREAREAGARRVMIATDGVFSMDGTLAPLREIVDLAARYEAAVMVDDCHATGFLGPKGAGAPAHLGVADGVDLLTGTLGKALGGAIGGYVAGPQPAVDMLRQRGRPYLFSNALPPMVCAASLEALRIAAEGDALRTRLFELAARWRAELRSMGFEVWGDDHPIVPVILGEARLAQAFAAGLRARGVHAPGFFFPVVPKGTARIRTQMNAALTDAQMNHALTAFSETGRELGVIG